MLMSLFSSFDALCAESIGQKVRLSWPPGVNTTKDAKQQQQQQQQGSIDGGNRVKEGSSSSSNDPKKAPNNHNHQLQQQQKRRPRFAVELDGVHCFETIIPY
ncbi:hypothetical protein ACH5RR_017296 [Cinchona calisaya]|uniref:Uncharacterized protein n=1 Tax=Cinchona calisaya TaxID=153742 RepID=A0ABD3A209_9GENT